MLANNAKDECKLNFKLVYLDYALAIGYNFLQNFVGRSKGGHCYGKCIDNNISRVHVV